MSAWDVAFRVVAAIPTVVVCALVVAACLRYRRNSPGSAWVLVGLVIAFTTWALVARLREAWVMHTKLTSFILPEVGSLATTAFWLVLGTLVVPILVVGCGMVAWRLGKPVGRR